MDTLGAVIGPLFALLYLYFYPRDYKTLFYIAFIPGMLAVLTSLYLREKTNTDHKIKVAAPFFSFLHYWKTSPSEYRKVVLGLLVFTLFNRSDIFLLLQAKQSGFDDTTVIGVYLFYNLIYALFALPAGILADKVGLKTIFIIGLSLFAVVYIGMAFNKNVCDPASAVQPSAQGQDPGPTEAALVFEASGQPLLGVLTMPAGGSDDRGVIIVVGGPQYRAGSHRLFVQLARHLACRGITTLRFDVRGMGDSPGDWRGFEQLDDDLSADGRCPTRRAPPAPVHDVGPVRRRIGRADVWGPGLGCTDDHALALVNPWVRSEQGEARTRVRHYYRDRLLQPEFWRKLAS